MPIYEYRCQKCGFKFEKLILDKEQVKCPKCNSKKLEKLLPSSFNVGKTTKNDFKGCSGGICPFTTKS